MVPGPVPGPSGGMVGDAPVRQADQQAHIRPFTPPPNPHVHQVTRQMRVRGVVVELAVQQIREFDLVDPHPVRFEPLARVSARHALFEHDAVNASSVRSDGAPF